MTVLPSCFWHGHISPSGLCYRVGPNSPELTAFPVASVRINELMPKLLAELQGPLVRVWSLVREAPNLAQCLPFNDTLSLNTRKLSVY